MGNDKETSSDQQQQHQQQVKAPTYNELTMLIGELRERLQVAERAAEQMKSGNASVTSESTSKCNEIRIFANLDHSVKVFTSQIMMLPT